MRSDADFDAYGQAFLRDVYGSSKGRVRLEVLAADLLAGIPLLAAGGLTVLDAGGGAGQLSIRLAALGNHVVLADPSQQMLNEATAAIERAGVADRITLVRSDIAGLSQIIDGSFGVVLCHAVLEWLADPRTAVMRLAPLLDAGGTLSLAFYNRNASVLKSMLEGEFAQALREESGQVQARGGESGVVALAERDVREWVHQADLTVYAKAGIRIFHDHLRPDNRTAEWMDDLLVAERQLRQEEPFASLGQHIHLLCTCSTATQASHRPRPTRLDVTESTSG
ncbi:MAG: methyltransferase domain-containing protein [Pseudonocardiaceae bacterium]